jgi:hypothetical protein
MPAKLTKNTFMEKAILVHLWEYEEYGEYVDSHTPITIICKEHGPFDQLPYTHLRGAGCPKCAREITRRSLSSFLDKAHAIHGDHYSYQLIEAGWVHGDVTIICNTCNGYITVDAVYHMKGGPRKCPECHL